MISLRRSSWALLLPLALLADSPSAAVDESSIEAALARGRAAKSEEEVPALVAVGSVAVGKGDADRWTFYIGSCATWIAHLAFLSRETGREVDLGDVRRRCLGAGDELRVAVLPVDRPGIGQAAKPIPAVEDPPVELQLLVEGREAELQSALDFARYGEGSAFGIFGPTKVSGGSQIQVMVRLRSGRPLVLKVKAKALKRVF